MIVASAALTPGVISDNRATAEMIKAFEVNRIVYGIYLEVDLWVRNGLGLWKKVANAGDFKYSTPVPQLGTSVRCCPSNAQKTPRGPAASTSGSEITAKRFSCLAAQMISESVSINATLIDKHFVASESPIYGFGLGSLLVRNKDPLTVTPKCSGLSEVILILRSEQCPRCLRPGRGPGYGPDCFPPATFSSTGECLIQRVRVSASLL